MMTKLQFIINVIGAVIVAICIIAILIIDLFQP